MKRLKLIQSALLAFASFLYLFLSAATAQAQSPASGMTQRLGELASYVISSPADSISPSAEDDTVGTEAMGARADVPVSEARGLTMWSDTIPRAKPVQIDSQGVMDSKSKDKTRASQ